MWVHIVKTDNKLYQDGIEVKSLDIPDAIIDFEIKGKDNLWIKFKK